MKISELRQKSEAELQELESNLRLEQFNLRMQKSTGQLAKPDQVKKIRRQIARIYTLRSENERAK